MTTKTLYTSPWVETVHGACKQEVHAQAATAELWRCTKIPGRPQIACELLAEGPVADADALIELAKLSEDDPFLDVPFGDGE